MFILELTEGPVAVDSLLHGELPGAIVFLKKGEVKDDYEHTIFANYSINRFSNRVGYFMQL
jgi:hypothetical protein